MFGKYIHAFRLGQEVEDTKVIDAEVFHTAAGTGVCVLTGAYRLFLTNSVKEPKVRKLSEIPGTFWCCSFADKIRVFFYGLFVFSGEVGVPNSWAVICEERQTFVLLSKNTELFYISDSQVIQKVCSKCSVYVNDS